MCEALRKICCCCCCGDQSQIASAGVSETTRLLASSPTTTPSGRVSGDGSDNVSKTSSTTEKTPSTHSTSPQPVVVRSPSPSSRHDPESRAARFSPSVEVRNKDRMKQEEEEHAAVRDLIRRINDGERYNIEEVERSLGGRLQKYWYLASAQGDGRQLLLTVAPLSKRCAINMSNLKALNGVVSKLGKHPLLQPIHEILYRDGKVLIFQPLMEGGSLRDYLHKVKDPLKDWAEKYALKGRTRMTREEIAVCAKSVMEAIQFLYDKGFPAMGHIQTGNIFKTEEGYKLGGYENVLLGYKSRDHQLCLEYGKDMDIIMLGHVIYEMASDGRELKDIIPSDESDEYQHVKDEAVKAVLKHIFHMVCEASSVPRDNLQELLCYEFFSSVPKGKIEVRCDCKLDRQEKALMKEVREGREKHQKEKKALSEKEKSVRAMNIYFEKKSWKLATVDNLMSIGTRAGKFWVRFQKDGKHILLSAVEVSRNCPIVLTPDLMTTIREFFRKCKHHNLALQNLDDLKFYNNHVVLLQEFHEQGSLRDLIYQTRSWLKWSEKKRVTGKRLEKDRIQVYAKQILMACRCLYQLGFPQLGQIQSGNIFIEGDNLRLGGFENTLFGYRAVGSEKFQRYYGHLDRMMFGHVVYEMGAGTTVETAIPTDADYKKIGNKLVRAFVMSLFAGINETPVADPSVGSSVDSRSGASRLTPVNMGWIEHLLTHDFLHGCTVEDAGVPEDVADILKNVLKEVQRDRPKKQRSIFQFGANVRRTFRPKSRVHHESSSSTQP